MGVYGCSCVCGWGRRAVCVRSRVDRDRTCDVMQPIFDHDEEEDIQVRVGWMCVRAEGWQGGVCLFVCVPAGMDIDQIWGVMQPIFGDHTQEDIQVCLWRVWVSVSGWKGLSLCLCTI